MKTCPKCREHKPLDAFYPRTGGGTQSSCKACHIADMSRRAKDPEVRARRLERQRARRSTPEGRQAKRYTHVKSTYGLTREAYAELLEHQGGKCAICAAPLRRPAVDHDHATGLVRGLLCSTCNTGIGHLKDDPAVLRSALAYLEAHSG